MINVHVVMCLLLLHTVPEACLPPAGRRAKRFDRTCSAGHSSRGHPQWSSESQFCDDGMWNAPLHAPGRRAETTSIPTCSKAFPRHAAIWTSASPVSSSPVRHPDFPELLQPTLPDSVARSQANSSVEGRQNADAIPRLVFDSPFLEIVPRRFQVLTRDDSKSFQII